VLVRRSWSMGGNERTKYQRRLPEMKQEMPPIKKRPGSTAMQARIRLGVIGLGRRWQRYREALARLSDQVQIHAVCDPIGQRTEAVARQLHCTAAGGPIDLLDRNDVEAVLLLDRPWYGLWPLERACRRGKPVFCAISLTSEGPFAE